MHVIQAPTLVVSARDDGFGTFAPAQYTASQIAGAALLGLDQGGHLLAGHDEKVQRYSFNVEIDRATMSPIDASFAHDFLQHLSKVTSAPHDGHDNQETMWDS